MKNVTKETQEKYPELTSVKWVRDKNGQLYMKLMDGYIPVEE